MSLPLLEKVPGHSVTGITAIMSLGTLFYFGVLSSHGSFWGFINKKNKGHKIIVFYFNWNWLVLLNTINLALIFQEIVEKDLNPKIKKKHWFWLHNQNFLKRMRFQKYKNSFKFFRHKLLICTLFFPIKITSIVYLGKIIWTFLYYPPGTLFQIHNISRET